MKKLITLIALLVIAGSAQAALLLYEGFDGTVGNDLRNESDWGYAGSKDGAPVTRSGNLTVSGLKASTGNMVKADEQGGVGPRTFTSPSIALGADVYHSLAISVSSVSELGTGVALYGGLGQSNLIALRQNAGGTTFDIGIFYGTGDMPTPSPGNQGAWDDNGGAGYALNATHFLVMGLDDDWSSATDGRLWINPDSSTFGGATPGTHDLAIDGRDQAGTAALTLFHTAGQYVTVDELRVGDTYKDVTPVPEPATVGMLGLGAFVAMLIRRIRA